MPKIVYSAHHINREIDVNNFDDTLWKSAEPTVWYIPGTAKKPITKREGGVLWSDKYLYFRIKTYDKDIYAYNTERNSATFEDDVSEIFLKTDPAGDAYYNFEINALNAVYDSYQPKRDFAGGDKRWSKWDSQGLKSAVYINGTINNPKDEDEYWILQGAIPFEDLEIPSKKVPQIGDTWNFLLAGYDYSVFLPDNGMELASVCLFEQGKVRFHFSERWNILKFTK